MELKINSEQFNNIKSHLDNPLIRQYAIVDKKFLQALIPYCPQHLLRQEKLGLFPSRIQVGMNRVGWFLSDIIEWIESRPRVHGDENETDRNDFLDRIETHPHRHNGQPYLKGSLIPVLEIIDLLLKKRKSPGEIIKLHPSVKAEDITACLKYINYVTDNSLGME